MASKVINLSKVIDQPRLTSLQVRVMVLCALVSMLDGLDTQSIGVAAPMIAERLGVSRAALGPVFSAALFGAMIGALSFGMLADRFGRKRILILSTAAFGLFTILTALADSYNTLLAYRFLAGLGLGGEGWLSYSIAAQTGEGVTNPGTFTRARRCVMVDPMRTD